MAQYPEYESCEYEFPLPENESRTFKRAKLTDLFEDLGNRYLKENFAEPLPIYQGTVVNAFYRSNIFNEYVIHVKGFPDRSSETKAYVFARVLDYKKMEQERKRGVEIGEEHKAVIAEFEAFKFGVVMDYDAKKLEELIKCELINTIITPEDYFLWRIFLK